MIDSEARIEELEKLTEVKDEKIHEYAIYPFRSQRFLTLLTFSIQFGSRNKIFNY